MPPPNMPLWHKHYFEAINVFFFFNSLHEESQKTEHFCDGHVWHGRTTCSASFRAQFLDDFVCEGPPGMGLRTFVQECPAADAWGASFFG